MSSSPSVGIVTRTKNRPVLLRRAIESVLEQTYTHWTLVIVNDGGDPRPVDELVNAYAARAQGRIQVIHNPHSLGMQGASAVGLRGLGTDLLIIHDDDDSWSPEFLAVTTAELGRHQAETPSVHGVTTYCNKVLEHVHGQTVHIVSVEPFHSWQKPGFLRLDRMLSSNFLPPICFLFTREAFEALGGVYEHVPYVGDWDFLIRFLCEYDIILIPQYLAFYHWRTKTSAAPFGNTVTGEVDRHEHYRNMLLNRWLRDDLKSGRFGVGAYANLRTHLEELLTHASDADAKIERLLQSASAEASPGNLRTDLGELLADANSAEAKTERLLHATQSASEEISPCDLRPDLEEPVANANGADPKSERLLLTVQSGSEEESLGETSSGVGIQTQRSHRVFTMVKRFFRIRNGE